MAIKYYAAQRPAGKLFITNDGNSMEDAWKRRESTNGINPRSCNKPNTRMFCGRYKMYIPIPAANSKADNAHWNERLITKALANGLKTAIFSIHNYYLIHFSNKAPINRPNNTNKGPPPDIIINAKKAKIAPPTIILIIFDIVFESTVFFFFGWLSMFLRASNSFSTSVKMLPHQPNLYGIPYE